MHDNPEQSRRDFIKTAGLVGGAALIGGVLPVAANAIEPSAVLPIDPLLKGVSDIHVHAAPDTRARAVNELAFARDAYRAGYRSVMFKSNDFSCHDPAYLIHEALTDFACFGSLCMNRVHGDKVNVKAAEAAVNTTGNYCRCIWLPTQDAAYQHAYDKLPGQGIPVLSDTGVVLPEVVRVMEICAEADIILASGHSSPAENIVLARKACEIGLNKFVITHANSHIWKMTREQIEEVVQLGGYIEFSYITNLAGPGTGVPHLTRMSDAEFTAFTQIAPERSFITTDLGQVNMPHPLKGMRRCIQALLANGVSRAHIDTMVRTNPAKLMGLDI